MYKNRGDWLLVKLTSINGVKPELGTGSDFFKYSLTKKETFQILFYFNFFFHKWTGFIVCQQNHQLIFTKTCAKYNLIITNFTFISSKHCQYSLNFVTL